MEDHGNKQVKVTGLYIVGEYHIEGQLLESVNVYEDLRLFTASNLSWNQHVGNTTTKRK